MYTELTEKSPSNTSIPYVTVPVPNVITKNVEELKQNGHVLVIGSGITALHVAYELLLKSYRVTILAHESPSQSSNLPFHVADAEKHDSISVALKDYVQITSHRLTMLAGQNVPGVIMQTINHAAYLAFHGQSAREVRSIHSDRDTVLQLLQSTVLGKVSPSMYEHLSCHQYCGPVVDIQKYIAWLKEYLQHHNHCTMQYNEIPLDIPGHEQQLTEEYGVSVIINTIPSVNDYAQQQGPQRHSYVGCLTLPNALHHSVGNPINQVIKISPFDQGLESIVLIPHGADLFVLAQMDQVPSVDLMQNSLVKCFPEFPVHILSKNDVQFHSYSNTIHVPSIKRHDNNLLVANTSGQIYSHSSYIIDCFYTNCSNYEMHHVFGYVEEVCKLLIKLEQDILEIEYDKLPDKISLVLILLANFMFNVSFYIIIPTATNYAHAFGAGDLYSGLVIGGITLMSGISLLPLNSIPRFRDYYMPTLDLAAICLIVGHLLYAFANAANSLSLLLIGRLVNGLGYTGWLFVKRYCTDPRIVGLRRRTMCSNFLVVAQTLGMVCGPLFGSLLSTISSSNRDTFNANTSPAFIMAGVWLIYWILVRIYFVEVPARTQEDILSIQNLKLSHMTINNWITSIIMCFISFVIWFILGAFESNIPIYGTLKWQWGTLQSGVFIAFGGISSFVLILPMSFYTRTFQDRSILITGLILSIIGVVLKIIPSDNVYQFGTSWFFVCWGLNLSSTITLSLMTKTLSNTLSDKAAIAVQLSNYTGRLLGAIWGTAGSTVGEATVDIVNGSFNSIAIGLVLICWSKLKALTG